ncbi:MAG: hypothetical protein H7Y17_17625 [Chlorobia bacterium]|nr:hypothetical protein [Fimbriimonadaceae bacterium]
MTVALIFWVLIFFGIKDGRLYYAEAIILGFIWLVLLMSVMRLSASMWWFYVPAALMTIYTIIRVLGPDAVSLTHRGGD